MVMNNTWLNSDGLYIKFGATEGVSRQQGGAVCVYGPFLDYYMDLDLTALSSTTTVIQNDVLVLPTNSMLVEVETLAIVAAATGTAVNVGLVANDRATATNIWSGSSGDEPTAILNGIVTADMDATGETERFTVATTFPSGKTTGGIGLGKILTIPCLFTAGTTDATAYTAGKVQLRVRVLPNATTGFRQPHVG